MALTGFPLPLTTHSPRSPQLSWVYAWQCREWKQDGEATAFRQGSGMMRCAVARQRLFRFVPCAWSWWVVWAPLVDNCRVGVAVL
jgi:hypothetical protein